MNDRRVLEDDVMESGLVQRARLEQCLPCRRVALEDSEMQHIGHVWRGKVIAVRDDLNKVGTHGGGCQWSRAGSHS